MPVIGASWPHRYASRVVCCSPGIIDVDPILCLKLGWYQSFVVSAETSVLVISFVSCRQRVRNDHAMVLHLTLIQTWNKIIVTVLAFLFHWYLFWARNIKVVVHGVWSRTHYRIVVDSRTIRRLISIQVIDACKILKSILVGDDRRVCCLSDVWLVFFIEVNDGLMHEVLILRWSHFGVSLVEKVVLSVVEVHFGGDCCALLYCFVIVTKILVKTSTSWTYFGVKQRLSPLSLYVFNDFLGFGSNLSVRVNEVLLDVWVLHSGPEHHVLIGRCMTHVLGGNTTHSMDVSLDCYLLLSGVANIVTSISLVLYLVNDRGSHWDAIFGLPDCLCYDRYCSFVVISQL